MKKRIVSGAGGQIGAAAASPAVKDDKFDGGTVCVTAVPRKLKWKRKLVNYQRVPLENFSVYFSNKEYYSNFIFKIYLQCNFCIIALCKENKVLLNKELEEHVFTES